MKKPVSIVSTPGWQKLMAEYGKKCSRAFRAFLPGGKPIKRKVA